MVSGLRFWLLLMLVGLAGCGGAGSNAGRPGTPQPSPPPAPSASPTPAPVALAADHVVLVMLENHSFSQVIGNPSMPFFNSLAAQNSLASNYFANAHPSISNYFMLTTGNVETNDDHFAGTIADDNIAAALTAAGKSWKAYMESLPAPGYTGGDVGPYLKQHDPFVFFKSVLASSTQSGNVVPFSELGIDMASGSLPSFALIVPNVEDDAHDCPGGGPGCSDSDKLAAADAWLQANVAPLINSPVFTNGVLIITFDEGTAADVANGGGQVAAVLVGPRVKSGFVSTTFYQHQNTLRLILDLLNVGDHPGASASAASMSEFFQ
jgi:acid phosphatase